MSGSPVPQLHEKGGVAGRSSLIKKLRSFPLIWPVLALLLIVAANVVIGLIKQGFHPEAFSFFKLSMQDGQLYGTMVKILRDASPVTLMALGMALVIGTGGIDLSVGTVMGLAGTMAAVMIVPEKSLFHWMQPHGWAIAMAAGLGIGLLAGAWNGMLVTVFKVQPIVATLVMMVAGRGLAQLLAGDVQPALEGLSPGYEFLGRGHLFWLPFSITVAVLATVVTIALARLTALGLFIEAVGNNPGAARYAGVPARVVTIVAYAFSGLCAGMAGLIETSNVMAADPAKTGQYKELDAILAVALGGTALTGGRFSILGAVIGAVIMQTLQNTVTSNLPAETNLVIEAVVVVMICLLQSERFRGLFVRVGRLFQRRGGGGRVAV